MKHCPACNFSFPDFHHVCDFDGTELVPDSAPLSLVKPRRIRRVFSPLLQSPVFWGSALAFVAVFNAFLILLYDASSQSIPAVKPQPSPDSPASIGSFIPFEPTRESWPALSRKAAPATLSSRTHLSRSSSSSASQRRPAQTARTPARPQTASVARQPKPIRDTSPIDQSPRASISRGVLDKEVANSNSKKSEVAQQKDPQRSSRQKDHKLTAMLKTTWRVLKKPFKF